MKKINLKGISEILSEKELKNVMGGSGGYRCCCGMGANVSCFDVNAESYNDALWALSYICSGGGGCFA